jgi:hypothetical protein
MQIPVAHRWRGKLITGAPGMPAMKRRRPGGRIVTRNRGLPTLHRETTGCRAVRLDPARTAPQPPEDTSATNDCGLACAWIRTGWPGRDTRAQPYEPWLVCRPPGGVLRTVIRVQTLAPWDVISSV